MRTSRAFGTRHDVRMARRGRRGEGTVYYSKAERRWVARFPLGIVGGKRKARRVTARSEREARRKLDQLQRTHGRTAATGSLDRYLSDWLDTPRDIEASTLRSYREHVTLHISPLLGGIPVAELQVDDVDRLIRELLRKRGARGRPLAPATVARIVTTLRIALQRGVKRGTLPVNVAALADLPRVPERPVQAMSEAAADRIIDATRDHWLGPLVRLLLGSGLRLGEAVSLNQGDVHEGFVRLRASKTTIRAVPISEDAQDALREHIAAHPRIGPDEPLFVSPKGQRKRLLASTASHALPRVLEQAGLPRVTPHGLRHGAATLMVADGVHMRVIAAQLGHKNPALTARVYAHVIPELQREAVRALPRRRDAR